MSNETFTSKSQEFLAVIKPKPKPDRVNKIDLEIKQATKKVINILG